MNCSTFIGLSFIMYRGLLMCTDARRVVYAEVYYEVHKQFKHVIGRFQNTILIRTIATAVFPHTL